VDRFHERVEVADALFEQVADPFGALADQVERIARLVVLRQHEHRGFGAAPAQFDGRA
jgi:hypothetical protein